MPNQESNQRSVRNTLAFRSSPIASRVGVDRKEKRTYRCVTLPAYEHKLSDGRIVVPIHRDVRSIRIGSERQDRWQKDKGMRLDHVLLLPSISDRLVSGGVDRWVRGEVNASDHAPAWINLDV